MYCVNVVLSYAIMRYIPYPFLYLWERQNEYARPMEVYSLNWK